MSKDHLDNEISVSGQLTPDGFRAGAKSRFISAVDRLAGNSVDWLNNKVEGRNQLTRAKFEGEAKIISATAQSVADQIGADPEFARRALETHFGTIIREQENKDAVLDVAYRELKSLPGPEKESDKPLDDEFLDRIEEYAKRASTEQLRERWGRILSAEVQEPGTFAARVLRVVDEIDAQTAHDFQAFCGNAIVNVVPRVLTGEVPYHVQRRLVEAELVHEPGIGQILNHQMVEGGPAGEVCVWKITQFALYFPTNGKQPQIDAKNEALSRKLDLKVYLLTTAGQALKSILDIKESENVRRLRDALQTHLPEHRLVALDGQKVMP